MQTEITRTRKEIKDSFKSPQEKSNMWAIRMAKAKCPKAILMFFNESILMGDEETRSRMTVNLIKSACNINPRLRELFKVTA